MKRKTIRKWEEILSFVRIRDSPWCINRLWRPLTTTEPKNLKLVLFYSGFICAERNYKLSEKLVSNKNDLRRVLLSLESWKSIRFYSLFLHFAVECPSYSSFWQTLLTPFFLRETHSKTCSFLFALVKSLPVFSAEVNGNAIRFGNSGGVEPRNCFSFIMAINQKRSYMCMLSTWMLLKRAAVSVTTSIITSAQKTVTTRWRVNGDGPFQVSGYFSFLNGTRE